ncbi:MAG TPA: YnfA family protein [Burkholderiales bacterium]|nr:YnfA family protein [Burkholderiales bacterium]
MKNYLWFILASIAEIAGCFAFWAWLRLGKSGLWVMPGMLSLAFFAFILTRVNLPPNVAGRAYAAYGGIYITSSLIWLWLAEGMHPTRWDLIGAGICLLGMSVILIGSKTV